MINLYDLLEASQGQLFGEPAAHLFRNFCVDPREGAEDCLFVAVRTGRGDGHTQMKEAVERGATGLLCSQPPDFDTRGISVVLVRNPLHALMSWSHFVVGSSGVRVIAVAGAAGRSTALAAIARVLGLRHRVLVSSGAYDGRLDLAFTLARLEPQHEMAVLALDVAQPGEMAEMVGAVRPQVGVIPHLGYGPHEYFERPEHLAREVGQLVSYLSPSGLAVLNYDDDDVRGLSARARAQVVTVSAEVAFGADVIAENIVLGSTRTGFDLRCNDLRYVGRWTPLLGRQQLTAALTALAVGSYFGIPVADALHELSALEALPGMLRPLAGVNDCALIDDTASADPWSALAALDWLKAQKRAAGRVIVVLGDMDPLGKASARGHRLVGQRVAEVADVLVTNGSEAALAARAALDLGMPAAAVSITHSAEDAYASTLAAGLMASDIVLVKGGARARMDLVVRNLLHRPEDALMLSRHEVEAPSIRPQRPSWVEIDHAALADNVRAIRAHIGADVTLFAVVKADAYGHGANSVAQTALQNGAQALAVANLNEATVLREAGVNAPILVLGYTPADAARQALQHDLTVTLYDLELARAFDMAAREAGRRLRAHVKIDTGMGRLGVLPDRVVPFFRHLSKLTALDIEGVYTHYSMADEDADYTREQTRRFRDALAPLRAAGFSFRYVHAANSAGTLRGQEFHFNAVRVGLALYGLSPSAETPVLPGMRPVMTWKTVVAQVKTLPPNHGVGYGATYRTQAEETIAVLPVGYADGFRRAPQNPGQVLVRGQFAPVLGRVSMEKTVISVQAIPDVRVGDEVVLLGRQGSAEITADDIAARLGTINYEVVTSVLPRIPRR